MGHSGKAKQREYWTSGLTPRSHNILLGAGFYSKEDLLALLNSKGSDHLLSIQGLGRTSYNEILSWLGAAANGLPTGHEIRVRREAEKQINEAIHLLRSHGYTVEPPNVK